MKKAKSTTKITVKRPSKRAKLRELSRATLAGAPTIVDETSLLSDLRNLIQAARERVVTVANSNQTMLCWYVGRRLLRENLQEGRAAYGKRILATVSQQLTVKYCDGFTFHSLYRSIQFCQVFPDEAIVSMLSTQLSCSHFMELLPIKDSLAHAREQAARQRTHVAAEVGTQRPLEVIAKKLPKEKQNNAPIGGDT